MATKKMSPAEILWNHGSSEGPPGPRMPREMSREEWEAERQATSIPLTGLFSKEKCARIVSDYIDRRMDVTDPEGPSQIPQMSVWNLRNLGWDNPNERERKQGRKRSNIRLVELRIHPGCLPKEVLGSINQALIEQGDTPFPRNPDDLANGAKKRVLSLPMEVRIDDFPALQKHGNGDWTRLPEQNPIVKWLDPDSCEVAEVAAWGEDDLAKRNHFVQENPNLEMDPVFWKQTKKEAGFYATEYFRVEPDVPEAIVNTEVGKFPLAVQMGLGTEEESAALKAACDRIRQTLTHLDREGNAQHERTEIHSLNPDVVQQLAEQSATSQYLEMVSRMGHLEPGAKQVSCSGRIWIEASALAHAIGRVHTNLDRKPLVWQYENARAPLRVAPLDGRQDILGIHSSYQAARNRRQEQEREGESRNPAGASL